MASLSTRDSPKPAEQRPVAVTATIDTNGLADALAQAIRQINIPAAQVTVDAPVVNTPKVVIPTPPKSWRFAVKRDKDGFISEIVATAG